jgi:hypothetical protein
LEILLSLDHIFVSKSGKFAPKQRKETKYLGGVRFEEHSRTLWNNYGAPREFEATKGDKIFGRSEV